MSKPLEARFLSTPLDASAAVYVALIEPAGDGDAEPRGPVTWNALPGDLWPTEGDLALVEESDQGRWWVLQWTPAAVVEMTMMLQVTEGEPGNETTPGYYVDTGSDDYDLYEVKP